MNKIIFFTLLSCLLTLKAYSSENYQLEAKSLKELITAIKATKFKYKERGMIHGYNSIQSCLYTSSDIAILKNYCFPAKNYPAKSFTIISKKFGMIELYQEDLGVPTIKHDVMINTFPDILKDYFPGELTSESIASVNVNLIKLYNESVPACWSTNFSFEAGIPDVGCYKADETNVGNLKNWTQETQAITADEKDWNNMLSEIETNINQF